MVSSRELFKQGYNASNNKEFEKAEKYYRNCLEIDSDYSMAWNNLGWILYDQNQQFKEAERCYNLAIKADKKNYYAWNNLGILYYRHKKKYPLLMSLTIILINKPAIQFLKMKV